MAGKKLNCDIEFSENGGIRISIDQSKSFIQMDDEKIVLSFNNQSSITLDATGVTINSMKNINALANQTIALNASTGLTGNCGGTKIDCQAGGLDMNSPGPINLKGGEIHLN
ncbi:hypothetical protein [Piscirickettsia litoralis]|uniref:Adhesin domain-containing protein n=1 Tax=Piscirickettsia litoralis TaxID=1891921 RepID=A0ABX3A0R6_9GAMM|nr:hypothetical protein [Piscirickettsia litoralis]ODN42219.1 hypothetical protein BGC07_03795 [Piscirickettsia litoralis]